MRILIIDNNLDVDDWGAADLVPFAAKTGGAEVHVRRGPHEDVPSPEKYDKVVISGSRASVLEESPWISMLDGFIRRAVEGGTHLLGVCYGHQAIARAVGGKACVRRSATPEFGWTKIVQVASSGLFKGLPQEFHSSSSHFDEVSAVPPGARLLARSDCCDVQAFELPGHAVFGVQFHPERGREDGDAVTVRIHKKTGRSDILLNPGRGRELHDPSVAEKIFGNFFSL